MKMILVLKIFVHSIEIVSDFILLLAVSKKRNKKTALIFRENSKVCEERSANLLKGSVNVIVFRRMRSAYFHHFFWK